MSRASEFPDDEGPFSEGPGREEERGKSPLKLPKLSFGARLSAFYQAVKLEMRKTTWPTRTDVWSTTVVVLLAITFFGFYLWGVDVLVTIGFEALEKTIR